MHRSLVRPAQRWMFLFLLLLAACSGSHTDGTLQVKVVTSLVPGVEFNRVETTLMQWTANGPVTIETQEASAFLGQPYARGQKTATFSEVQRGDILVRVRAWRPQGLLLVSQDVRLGFTASTTATVILDRECVAVSCPSPGGSAAFTACLAGQCVDPRCNPDDESTREFCPGITFCTTEEQCDPVPTCAERACVSGVCVPAPVEGACDGDEYCDVNASGDACKDVTTQPNDAGISLCGQICLYQGNPCLVGYWSCADAGTPTCSGFVYAPTDTTCGEARACDGRGQCVSALADAGVDADVDAQTDGEVPDAGVDAQADGDVDADLPDMHIVVTPDADAPDVHVVVLPDAELPDMTVVVPPDAALPDAALPDADEEADAFVAPDAAPDASCTGTTWYVDDDNDSFGDSAHSVVACVGPTGYVANGMDCNDNDDAIHPSATEVCNAIDDDCDSFIDDGLTVVTYYADVDEDGYGDVLTSQSSCTPISGMVTNSTDCDDGNDAVHPGATELCNGFDEDCDEQLDETFATTSVTLRSPTDYDTYKHCAQLGSITLPYDSTLTAITFLNLQVLTNGLASASTWPNQNATITSLSFPALTQSGAIGLREMTTLQSFSAPLLEQASGVSFQYNGAFTTLSLPALETITGGIIFWGNTALTSISFPALTTIGTSDVSISSNHAITSISMPLLTSVNSSFGMDYENSLTSLVVNSSLYVTGNVTFNAIPNLCNVPAIACGGTCSTYDPC